MKELIRKIVKSEWYMMFWAFISIVILHIGTFYGGNRIFIIITLVAVIKLLILIILRTIYFHKKDIDELEGVGNMNTED